MKRILIVDKFCPKPYNDLTLDTEPMGGTEATVVRINRGLSNHNMLYVAQHNREQQDDCGYIPLKGAYERSKWDAIVLLRTCQDLAEASKVCKNVFVWLHDLPGDSLLADSELIVTYKPHLICVSNYHKTIVTERLRTRIAAWAMPRISVVYNPIDDTLQPDGTEYDKNKLVFFSSPHKGLDHALDYFSNLLSFNPSFKLYIANPGYLQNALVGGGWARNIINLGSLSHSDILEHVRSSLCVFYPNFIFPETFGLVMAEANAVGTPVITHPLGAASEVTYHPYELVDCRNPKALIDRVMAWHNGYRPVVKGNPDFKTSTVCKRWERLIGERK